MPEVTVRPARAEDRGGLLDLIIEMQEHERRLHDGLLPGAEIAEPYLAFLEHHARANDGVILVAESGDRVAGFVACLIDRYEGPEEARDSAVYGLVSDIAVAPAARGHGIGQALLSAAEAHARARGMTRLRIEVLHDNALAKAAYRRFGFVPYVEMLEKRL